MEDFAAFTAPNHSGSFAKNFVKFKKNVIFRLGGPYGEKLRPRSHFFTLHTSQPANNIYISTIFGSVCNSQGSYCLFYKSRRKEIIIKTKLIHKARSVMKTKWR